MPALPRRACVSMVMDQWSSAFVEVADDPRRMEYLEVLLALFVPNVLLKHCEPYVKRESGLTPSPLCAFGLFCFAFFVWEVEKMFAGRLRLVHSVNTAPSL